MNETIFILLPVHNRREITRRFIECLKAQTYKNYHLVLIDDGSADGTAEMVRESVSSLTVLTGKGKWWWAGSLQQGYLWLKDQTVANDSIILIINDDTVFEHDFLEEGVKSLKSQDHTLLIAQYYSLQNGRLLDSGLHLDWRTFSCIQACSTDEINCASTRGLFMKFADFTKIGGFFPTLLPHYYSDYEFTTRAYRKGLKLQSNVKVKLWGDEDTTGVHAVETKSIIHTLVTLFSIKTIPNPAVITVYIILSCPMRWILINLLRSWYSAFLILKAAFINDFRKCFCS